MSHAAPSPQFPFSSAGERAAWLKTLPIFSEAELETLGLYAAGMTDRVWQPGEIVCSQGETSTDVFLLFDGDTEIRIEHDGRRVGTDRVSSGACVGEMAVLTGQPRSATVIAGADGVKTVAVPGPMFRNLMLVQPAVGVNLLSVMGQRLRQNQLRAQNAELSRQVEEVSQSAATALETLRAKSDLLAGISHELRTPLNGILGLTELVLESSLTPTQRDYLTLVRDSGESLLTLINDLLDFSKIEAGRMTLESTPFALRDRLGDMLKPLALRAHRKGLEIGYRVAPEVPDVLLGDVTRLRQVIVNLAGNAIKFTEQGEIDVEVHLVEGAADSAALKFAIRDTGIGIPAENLVKLFRPYAQADASIARRFGGTGLGLAISRKLVECMQGEFHVESVVGRGSTFSFTARFGLGPSAEDEEQRAARRQLAGRRALIVDAHSLTRERLSEIVTDLEVQVVTDVDLPTLIGSSACSMNPAGAQIDSPKPVDVVIVDARAVGEAEPFARLADPATPPCVILVTADRADVREQCDRLRLTHLMKPVKPSELRDALVAELPATPPITAAVSTAADSTAAQTAAAASAETTATTPASAVLAPDAIALPVGGVSDAASGGATSELGANRASPAVYVLLAEDNPINQRVARSLLEKQGYLVYVVNNGREAVAACEAHRFDVVLMDVLMPEMDGLEATAAIRSRERKAGGRLPIIAMTAHSAEEDGDRCRDAGMDGFLSKPARPQQLYETIQTVMTRVRASASSDVLSSSESSGSGAGTGAALSPEGIWEPNEALRKAGGNAALLAQMVALVLQELPRLLAEVEASVAAGDPDAVRRTAHTLKGVVRGLFARRVIEQAERLEELGSRHDLSEVTDRFTGLRQGVEELAAVLTDVSRTISRSSFPA